MSAERESPRAARGAVLGALVAVQVFFGLHYLAAKLLLEEIEPRAWAALRVAAAAGLLLGSAALAGRRWPARRDLPAIAGLSLFGVVINQVCFVEGLHRTTPAHSAIINTTIPALTLLFAVLLGREPLTGGKALSLLLACGGAVIVIGPTRAAAAPGQVAGDLLTLLNATSFSFFLAASKKILSRNDPLGVTAALFGFGAAGVAALGAPALARFDPAAVSAAGWGLALFIVLFPTAGAYLLNYWALARVDPSVVALFIYLQPLIAALLSVLLLGEVLTVQVVAGGALVFAGVYLAVRPPGRVRPARAGRPARGGPASRP